MGIGGKKKKQGEGKGGRKALNAKCLCELDSGVGDGDMGK